MTHRTQSEIQGKGIQKRHGFIAQKIRKVWISIYWFVKFAAKIGAEFDIDTYVD